jgi:N-succinyl-L-ornithine transcarbamylase
MKHYLSISDLVTPEQAVSEALALAENPLQHKELGLDKTLVLLFFNNSLRTRLSTVKAAQNLGMRVMSLNVGADSWQLEFEDGSVMDQGKAEHIREAVPVICQYADFIGLRSFGELKNLEVDRSEPVLQAFLELSTKPLLNLESAMAHPLQAFADAMTLKKQFGDKKPKIVLSWAPHPKPLPQAVPHSFLRMMRALDADIAVCHPKGYDLDKGLAKGIRISHDQESLLAEADVVYAKSWCSTAAYGQHLAVDRSWTITDDLLGEAYFMHCLPVRRNVVVADSVLDSKRSLVLQQARYRTYSAQWVLKELITSEKGTA